MKKHTPTVWEALNDPVIELSEQQAKNVILASLVIMLAAWIAPYWGSSTGSQYTSQGTAFERVAGATIDTASAPDWYYTLEAVPDTLAQTVTDSATDVLDISEPVQNLVEFYEPGVSATWNAWLNLMRDPGTPEF